MLHIGHTKVASYAGAFSPLEGYSRAARIWTDVSCGRERIIIIIIIIIYPADPQ